MDIVGFCSNVINALMKLVVVVYDFFSYQFNIPGIGTIDMWMLLSGIGFVTLLLIKLFL